MLFFFKCPKCPWTLADLNTLYKKYSDHLIKANTTLLNDSTTSKKYYH